MKKIIRATVSQATNLRNLSVGDRIEGISDGTNLYSAVIEDISVSYDLHGKGTAFLKYTLTNESTGREFVESNSAEAFYRNYVVTEYQNDPDYKSVTNAMGGTKLGKSKFVAAGRQLYDGIFFYGTRKEAIEQFAEWLVEDADKTANGLPDRNRAFAQVNFDQYSAYYNEAEKKALDIIRNRPVYY